MHEKETCEETGEKAERKFEERLAASPIKEETQRAESKEEDEATEAVVKEPKEETAEENASAYQPTFLTALRCESASATMDSRRDSLRWQLSPEDQSELEAAAKRRHRFRMLQEAEEDEERRKEALLMRIRALDDELNCREAAKSPKRREDPKPSAEAPSQSARPAAGQQRTDLFESSEASYTLPPVSPPSKATPEREKRLLIELFGEKVLEEPVLAKSKPMLTTSKPNPFHQHERAPLPWEVVVDLEMENLDPRHH